MSRALVVGSIVMLAACPGGGDDGVDPDAPPGASGLRVTWATEPAVPGAISADLTIDDVKLRLSSVRAIGDAAPGDARTSTGGLELFWDDDQQPSPIELPDAPAGLYSRLELGSGGDSEEYTLRGRVRLDGTWYPYRIEDRAPLSVAIPLDVVLAPGAVVEIPVVCDLAPVLAAVPFAQLENEGGELQLDEDDAEIAAVRAAMVRALRLDAAGVR